MYLFFLYIFISLFSRNSVRIILTKDGDRLYPEVSLKENEIEGADVNVKHNMVRFESGHEIAHNHKIVKATLEHEKKTDELKAAAKKRGDTYELGKRRRAKGDALSRKYGHYIEREAVDTCKMLYAQGKRHLVFENLQGLFGKTFATSDIYDVNHNRLTSAMHISSVKDIFMRIAPKYGLSVSLVNPAYTSQTCPRCGCVVILRVEKPLITLHQAKRHQKIWQTTMRGVWLPSLTRGGSPGCQAKQFATGWRFARRLRYWSCKNSH